MTLPLGPEPAQGIRLDRLLQQWAVAVCGLLPAFVRPRWQRHPPQQPNLEESWAAIGILSQVTDSGTPYQYLHGEEDIYTIIRHEELDVLVTFYGPEAPNLAVRFRDGVYLPQHHWLLNDSGFVLVEAEAAMVVNEPFQAQWLLRIDVPVRLRRAVGHDYQGAHLVAAPFLIKRSD